MTCELYLQWLAMAGLKSALSLASAHAGHIVFHGPREDVMPFFNSMVRKLLRHSAHPWCTRVHWAGVATCFSLIAGSRWVAGVRVLAATSGSSPC